MKRAARLVALICGASVTAATSAGLPAAAAPVPVDPENPQVADEWVNPAIRPGEGDKAELRLVDATPNPSTPNTMFHVKLRVSNSSDETMEELAVVLRRGPMTGSPWDQRAATVAQIGEYTPVGQRIELGPALKAGAEREVELDIEMPAHRGTYPVMLQLVDEYGATLDTERFHLSGAGPMPEGARPAGMTALYPISAEVDILPGETGDAPEDPPLILASEELAGELAPGGRLDELVDNYIAASADPRVGTAICAAIDPALIDTVDRMSRGYLVADERPAVVEEPKRLRDSWGSGGAEAGEAGTGAEDAAAWLAKLRDISATGCTVALPWANTDINALVRTGDPWLVREAIERGPFTLGRVLGSPGELNVVIPSAGYVTDDAVAALGWADHTRSTIPTEGLSGAWERAVTAANAAAPEAQGQPSSGSALERRDMAAPALAAAPQPAAPVRVLVPSSSVVADPSVPVATTATDPGQPAPLPADRFAWAAPGILSVSYQDSLASTWAAVGPNPQTPGYSTDWLRYDYTDDSELARRVNAASGVQVAAQSAWTWEGQPPREPVLVNPPASWSADDGAALLGALAELISAGAASPVAFADYLTVPAGAAVANATQVQPAFSDPAAYSDAEVLSATQQASFITDLSTILAPDPSIALTRYGFTLPLRRDILAAFSPPARRSREGYEDAVEHTAAWLSRSRATLGELRSAVTLIPPGNVYTRTSPSSPLLIVAQNGMPLPVDTSIRYVAPEGVRLNVPDELRIPARGSVTVQMTADLPQDARDTHLQLYLAGNQGPAISRPVDIAVRTASHALHSGLLAALASALVALMLLFSISRRRRRDVRPPPNGKDGASTAHARAPAPTKNGD
ncbi:hypothetical protein V6D40_09850 [Corynebacterium sp. Q4381]|uniref:hypothetical protein n=1 Tax=Corynebacterium sp. Marseille-Q4381 TaxID=3121597 RepID=UPI002FE68190